MPIVRPRQNAIVVGGSSGLGKGIAAAFLNRRVRHPNERHRVVIAGRDVAALEAVRDGLPDDSQRQDCGVRRLDARRWEDWQDMAAEVADDEDVDHVVYCAAQCEGPAPFVKASVSDVESIVSTNLLGAMYALRFAHAVKARHVYGVVGHGSDGAKTPDFGLYGCTKAALKQLFGTVGSEWTYDPPFDVPRPGVHVISPGFMRTRLTERMFDEGSTVPRLQRNVLEAIAADPDRVAASVVAQMLKLRTRSSGCVLRP